MVGYAHAVRLAPSHAPPQTALPAPLHAARCVPCGCPVTGVHVPATTSHASHCPPHAPSQHTPSVQWPLAQSCPELQVVPFGAAAASTNASATASIGASIAASTLAASIKCASLDGPSATEESSPHATTKHAQANNTVVPRDIRPPVGPSRISPGIMA